MKTYRLTALWDDEAKVWTTAETDIPGLVVEADSFEGFVALAEDLAPELVADNLPGSSGPFSLRVEAVRKMVVPALKCRRTSTTRSFAP
jgi:hypothetical protein